MTTANNKLTQSSNRSKVSDLLYPRHCSSFAFHGRYPCDGRPGIL